MAGSFLLFGAAFGERVPRLLSALSLRCLSSAPRP